MAHHTRILNKLSRPTKTGKRAKPKTGKTVIRILGRGVKGKLKAHN